MSQQDQPIDRQGIQVIARAAAVLRAVAQQPEGLSLGDLATRLRLARSTVQRIVAALVAEEMLISAGPRSGVTLGPALVRLGEAAIVDTERSVRPILQTLSVALGETVDLSVLRGPAAVFVDQIVGSSRLVATSKVGETFPLHCTANGKALLGRLNGARLEAMMAGPFVRFTPDTIVSPAALRQAIDEVRATGVAWDLEEHARGVSAVGAAFEDRSGREFAVSVPVPSARFTARRDDLVAALREAMTEIHAKLAGDRARTAAEAA